MNKNVRISSKEKQNCFFLYITMQENLIIFLAYWQKFVIPPSVHNKRRKEIEIGLGNKRNNAKDTTIPRVECFCQSNFLNHSSLARKNACAPCVKFMTNATLMIEQWEPINFEHWSMDCNLCDTQKNCSQALSRCHQAIASMVYLTLKPTLVTTSTSIE